jgi:hypothetical protein
MMFPHPSSFLDCVVLEGRDFIISPLNMQPVVQIYTEGGGHPLYILPLMAICSESRMLNTLHIISFNPHSLFYLSLSQNEKTGAL